VHVSSFGRFISNAFALRVVVALASAFIAALVAHVAIDVAGDYLLTHDTYDDDAHGSRYVASIALAIAAFVALSTFVRAVIAETRGVRGALRAALRSSVPASRVAFAAIVVSLALPLLLAMAWLDSIVAGVPPDDVGDLFGGSPALGVGTTIVASLATAIAVRALVALAARFHRSIVRVVCALVHAMVRREVGDACSVSRRTDDRPRVTACFRRSGGTDRAPPAAPRRVRTA
jgi:hypothetical protein